MPRPRPPASVATRGAAQRIVDRVQSNGETVGFDPASILMILTTVIPLLVKCFQKSPDDTASYVASKYDNASGTYSPMLVRRVAVQIRKKANRDRVTLTKSEVEALAIATLDEARETEGVKANRVGVWKEADKLAAFNEE